MTVTFRNKVDHRWNRIDRIMVKYNYMSRKSFSDKNLKELGNHEKIKK